MKTAWWLAVSFVAALGGAAAGADEWRQPRRDAQWRAPPPAWGQTPDGAPGYRAGPRQDWQNEGYPSYRRDRQRWRDTPHDRHESRRRDDWHEQGRDDRRGPRGDWRDDGKRRGGGHQREHEPEGHSAGFQDSAAPAGGRRPRAGLHHGWRERAIDIFDRSFKAFSGDSAAVHDTATQRTLEA